MGDLKIPEGERLAPIEEAAHRWGISPNTVRWWIQIGKIASCKLGEPGSRAGRRLIPVSEIDRIIAETYMPARAEFRSGEAQPQDQSLTATA